MILNRMREAAARYPDKIALRMKTGDRYEVRTYRDFLQDVASVAQALPDLGIAKGDRVAILSENRPEWMIAYLAVLACGAVVVPLDAQYTEEETALLLANSGARAVFVSAQCSLKIPRSDGLLVLSFDSADGVPFGGMLADHRNAELPPAPLSGDLAAILYTSGTTGDPKGVMLSQGNLASNLESVIKLGLFSEQDNLLLILPLHHTYAAMACILLPFALGATVTILNSLKGPDILACMRETGVTVLIGVPLLYAGLRRAIFEEIGKKPALLRALVKLLLTINSLVLKTLHKNMGKMFFSAVHAGFGPCFRFFASGGARLEPDVYTDMTNLGFTVIEGYGLTETSPVSAFNPISKQRAGSIGIALPDVEVRIANPDEQGMGELAIRGPNVMQGYYNKPRETAEVLREGWFYTGDLGYRDRDGYFFITGRSKEMLVLPSGKKIFPEELEKTYKQSPAIKEICLLSGERGLEAAIVPDFEYLRRMNSPNSRETIAFELEDLSNKLPPYKRITGLKIFKDPLPATRLGKLKRGKVRELYQKSGAGEEKTEAVDNTGLLETPVAKKLLICLEPFSVKKKILPDDNLELDLGLDSLARVELVVSIEQSFGILLPESFGSELFTVRDAVNRIRDLLASGQARPGEYARMSWGEILERDPDETARASLDLEPGPLKNLARFAVKLQIALAMKICGRLSVTGLEHLPAEGPYIIAPNHLSLTDVPAISAALPWRTASRVFFLGATEFFAGTIMSRISKVFQVIPVDMDARLYNALQLSAYVLRRGKVLLVFPEGSRSRDGGIKEFKKGVGIIAGELRIPVIPVAISGTYEMLPTGKYIPRPSKIRVSFGRKIDTSGKGYDEIVTELHHEVVRLLEQQKTGSSV